ncbi:MAG: DUF6438 domain-containing protein [Bacteroidota bacterium]
MFTNPKRPFVLTPLLLLGICSILLLSSCSRTSSSNARKSNGKQEPKEVPVFKEEEPKVTFSRVDDPVEKLDIPPKLLAKFMQEGCYGKCPEFSLEIFTDGSVHFSGIANTSLIGEYRSEVSKSVLVEFLTLADQIGFYNLADRYPATWQKEMAEFPVLTSFIQYQGRRHTVRNRHDSPVGLIRFEQFIKQSFLDLDWSPRN